MKIKNVTSYHILYNPAKYLRRSFSRKHFTAVCRLLFSLKAPSLIFDGVLNIPLLEQVFEIKQYGNSILNFLKSLIIRVTYHYYT